MDDGRSVGVSLGTGVSAGALVGVMVGVAVGIAVGVSSGPFPGSSRLSAVAVSSRASPSVWGVPGAAIAVPVALIAA
ncbi:MAG: hypothetical protein M5T61_08965 [Acidimicrobiia bacterium]|nr:hypothetical protein [Acidimicrobiia bacterium]